MKSCKCKNDNKSHETKKKYRIEVIETGEYFVTREEYQRNRHAGCYMNDTLVESIALSMSDSDPSFEAVMKIIETVNDQQLKIDDLNKKILNFNLAQEALKS